MKSKRKGQSDAKHWFFFRGGEPAHRIGSRSETQLLTTQFQLGAVSRVNQP